jgi:hypothetical protein
MLPEPLKDEVKKLVLPQLSTVYKLGPMLPETRKELNAFYKPYLVRLAKTLNSKKFRWGI